MRLSVTLGLTLLEVLVSLFLFSFLFLALEGEGVSLFYWRQKSYYAALAEQQLHNLEERLRMMGPASADLDQQLADWNEENKIVLPQGAGWLDGHYPTYSITLHWGEGGKEGCEGDQKMEGGCISEKMIF